MSDSIAQHGGWRRWVWLEWRRRAIAAAVLLGCLAVLLVGASLEPSAAGIGTHQQLNLPPCSFEARYDLPCPTCGVTTAFSLATDGRLVAAAATQPFGAAAALVLAMSAWVAGYVVVTASPAVGRLGVLLRPGWLAIGVTGAMVAGWAFKLAIG